MFRFLKPFVRRNGKTFRSELFIRCYGQTLRSKDFSVRFSRIKVIGSGAPGEPASFVLHSNTACHLFNCGEGTDRLGRVSRIVRWAKVQNIFLTSTDWSRIGGLIAAMNEMKAGCSNINFKIYGPEKLQPIIERMASIVELPESMVKFNCTDPYIAPGLRIDCLPLGSNNDNVAYICKMDPYKGKPSMHRCSDLDLPLGSIKKLSSNESISLSDGRIITPNDVVNFTDDEKSFVVVDINSLKYLRSLEQSEAFNSFLNSNKRPEVVVHFSRPHIFDTSDYKRFLEVTRARRHLVINESNKYSGLFDVHRRHVQFNQLDPDIFPPLNSSVDYNPPMFDANDEVDGQGTVHGVSTNTTYFLRNGRDSDDIKLDTVECAADESEIGTSVSVNSGEKSADRANQYPKIVFLGTSSQRSGPLRNVTSILVHSSDNSSILLDCGEGTCGQIIRFYGSKATQIIANIKAIFISHLHGDHHYGLFEMLLQRKRSGLSNQPPILLMIPCKEYAEWITFCSHHIEDVTNEFKFIDSSDLLATDLADDLLAHLNVSALRTCSVDHIESSFGISTTISGCTTGHEPFKLTYSGDTVPCDSLVELGQNSTLLIHEATFENSLLANAQHTKHSTIAQAIEQSAKMNAKYTILTHFSQRYILLPWIDGDLAENVGIAFDNMELVEEDFSKFSFLYPCMKITFDSYFKLTEKQATRNMARQAHKKN